MSVLLLGNIDIKNIPRILIRVLACTGYETWINPIGKQQNSHCHICLRATKTQDVALADEPILWQQFTFIKLENITKHTGRNIIRQLCKITMLSGLVYISLTPRPNDTSSLTFATLVVPLPDWLMGKLFMNKLFNNFKVFLLEILWFIDNGKDHQCSKVSMVVFIIFIEYKLRINNQVKHLVRRNVASANANPKIA